MKTLKNTVLITGGYSSRGISLAKLFTQAGNHVIITGRHQKKLDYVQRQLKDSTAIAFNACCEQSTRNFIETIKKDFPRLTTFINNPVSSEDFWVYLPEKTILNDYLSGPKALEGLLPLLLGQKTATIIDLLPVIDPFLKNNNLEITIKETINTYSQSLNYKLKGNPSIKITGEVVNEVLQTNTIVSSFFKSIFNSPRQEQTGISKNYNSSFNEYADWEPFFP